MTDYCPSCTYPLPHNHIEPEWVPATVDQITAGQTVRLEHGDGSVLVRKMFQWGDPFSLLRHTLESAEITTPEIERLIQNGWGLFVQATPNPAPEFPAEGGWYLDAVGYAFRVMVPLGESLSSSSRWAWWGNAQRVSLDELTAPFVRLAPVADTAKAVLARVIKEADVISTADLGYLERVVLPLVAAEYGVTDD